jgi:hypothetical protein
MQTRRLLAWSTVLTAGITLSACSDALEPPRTRDPPAPVLSVGGPGSAAASILDLMDHVNAGLELQGAGYRVEMAEYLTSPASGDEAGATLLARDLGNKRLSADFVAFDPRRTWSGSDTGSDDITFAIDQTGDAVPPFGGATAAATTAAIQAAMGTWSSVACSSLAVDQVADFGLDLGVVAFLNNLGGSPFVVADLMHAGWRDIDFAGGVLGVTFTFVFTSGGVPTDIDANGQDDVAFREIYYDPSWLWQVGSDIDVETVALHESGHGLSQAHFGNIFAKEGVLTASPRAVMNAIYGGVLHDLTGTDRGGHCGNWANWPGH